MSTKESNVVIVSSPEANWGRVRAYFTGGILITNDNSNFSSAHQFYALTLEKTWHLPRCYLSSDCVGDGSVDLSGGTLVGGATMTISGGTIQLGTPIEIRNATIKVQGAEQISMGKDSIGLPKDSEFVATDATLERSVTALPGGVSDIAVGGKISIKVGRFEARILAAHRKSITPVRRHLLIARLHELFRDAAHVDTRGLQRNEYKHN